jgi:hypothetical protein
MLVLLQSKFFWLCIFFTFSLLLGFSQKPRPGSRKTVITNTYGIQRPSNDSICFRCQQELQSFPKEIRRGFERRQNEIWFSVTDAVWIEKMFINDADGITVDIVSKNNTLCEADPPDRSSWVKGTLLPPVYKIALRKRGNITHNGGFEVKIGDVPVHLRSSDLEFNLVLIQNKALCHYNYFYNLPEQRWELLDMGLFWDTPQGKERLSLNDKSVSKQLKFVIPFEKDKYEYKLKDIQPIYDSLKLKDFIITAVSIWAFASVEGSAEHNLTLQRKRAESIVKVLQSYQMKGIKQEIITAENWVEFYKDIEKTKYASFQSQTKVQVKEALQKEVIPAELETILKKHRKAILYLELERKTPFAGKSNAFLKQAFKKAIVQKNTKEALDIQHLVFSKIQNKQLPNQFLDSLEIPPKAEFGSLLNNRLAFGYYTSEYDFQTSLEKFLALQKLTPDNANVCYNVCALQLQTWLSGYSTEVPTQLYQNIQALERLKTDKRLVKRMLINYHIINCEYLMDEKEYAAKDDGLRFIFDNYGYISMGEKDAVSLAQYLVSYSKLQWALELLEGYASKRDVTEDLLFYYLSLTIILPEPTVHEPFTRIIHKAILINQVRFCQLFNSIEKGGITFQLLDDDYFQALYCETCKQ